MEIKVLQPAYINYGVYALCLLKPLMSFRGRKELKKLLKT